MSGYQVVIGDLATASSTFHTEAQDLLKVVPKDGPHPPDCGGDGVDGMLSSVLQCLGLLNLQLSASIDGHSTKLQHAHDTYQHAEETCLQLARQISDPDKIK